MSTSADELFQAFVSEGGNSRQHLVSLIKKAQADKNYSLLVGKLMDYKRDSDPEGANWLPLLERALNELRAIASDEIEDGAGNLSLTPSEILVALVMLSDTVICINETLATDRFCGTPAVTLPADDKDKLQNQVVEPSIDWFDAHVGKAIEAVDNVDDLKEFAMATRPLKWCCGHVNYHRSALERIVQLTPAGDIGTELIAWMITACHGMSGFVHEDLVSAACQKGQVFKDVRVQNDEMEGYVILSDDGDPALVYGEDGENNQDLVSILGDLSVVQSLSLSSDFVVDDSKVASLLLKLGEGLMPNLKEVSFWSVPDEDTFNVWARALVQSGVLDGSKLSRVTVEEGSFETTPEDAVVENVAPDGSFPELLVVFNREALLKRGA
jgi:hypothetical protein